MSQFENTEGVRQGYIAGVAEHEGVDYLESGAKFDRWLAEHDAEVRARAKWEFLDEQLGNVRMQVEAERAGTIWGEKQ